MRNTNLAALAIAMGGIASLEAQQIVRDHEFKDATAWAIDDPLKPPTILSWGPLVIDAVLPPAWPMPKVGLRQRIRAPVAGWYHC